MDVFQGQNIIEFTSRFPSDKPCKKCLGELKWFLAFTCRKSPHQGAQIRMEYPLTCNRCSHIECSGVHTFFYNVKLRLLDGFYICFDMATTTIILSALQVAKRYSIQPSTARQFIHKVRELMKSNQNQSMDGELHVDKFVLGSQESLKVGRSYDRRKKVVSVVYLNDSGKIKRFSSMLIKDYSVKSLRPLFERHIAKIAQITTDEWKGYKSIAKEYSFTQISSELGLNSSAIHNLIREVKSWIRIAYSCVSKRHIESYLNEYSHRINRAQTKDAIFYNFISRVIKSYKLLNYKLV